MDDRYAAAGVDYGVLDEAKRAALGRARETSELLGARGGVANDASRGEPAFVFTLGDRTLAFVMEGLGTKSLIARACEHETGDAGWSAVAQDTVAAIVNDLICVGALPLVVNAYYATGSAGWFTGTRLDALARGWADACRSAGAVWGGGESPTLSGLVADEEIELAGSAVGEVPPGRAPILGDDLAPGDEIVLISSSGLHANGASLIRKLAAELPDGYASKLGDGSTLGRAALAPSIVYVSLVEALLQEDLPVTYLSHITGHGSRKVMRAARDVTYVVDSLPEVPELFRFACNALDMDEREAYGTFNMGIGFAVYARPGAGPRVVEVAERLGYSALVGGRVEAGPRAVVIEPLGVTYSADELSLR